MNGYRVLFGGVLVVLAGLIGGTGVGVASSAPNAPAPLKANTFEGCANGQAVTVGNSATGGDPFSSVDPGALQYSRRRWRHTVRARSI